LRVQPAEVQKPSGSVQRTTAQCYACETSGFSKDNVMHILVLILTAILVGTAPVARAQTAIDAEEQKSLPQAQDKVQVAPQIPPQAQEGPRPQAQESPRPPTSGRFSFNPVEGGLLRLDNESGEVAYCSSRAAGWVCEVVPIDRSAAETETLGVQKQVALLEKMDAAIAHLTDEVAALKREIADVSDPPPPQPPADLTPPSDKDSDTSVKLPTQQDIVRAKDYLENAWRRLVEMIVNLQKDIMRKG